MAGVLSTSTWDPEVPPSIPLYLPRNQLRNRNLSTSQQYLLSQSLVWDLGPLVLEAGECGHTEPVSLPRLCEPQQWGAEKKDLPRLTWALAQVPANGSQKAPSPGARNASTGAPPPRDPGHGKQRGERTKAPGSHPRGSPDPETATRPHAALQPRRREQRRHSEPGTQAKGGGGGRERFSSCQQTAPRKPPARARGIQAPAPPSPETLATESRGSPAEAERGGWWESAHRSLPVVLSPTRCSARLLSRLLVSDRNPRWWIRAALAGILGVIMQNNEGLVQAGKKQSPEDGMQGRAAASGGIDAGTVPGGISCWRRTSCLVKQMASECEGDPW
ncbi:uncharacterized protein PS065_008385 [Dugong dugon]